MPAITFAEPLRAALRFCRPYIVAPRSHWDDLDLAPLGVLVPESLRFDPTRLSSERFITWIERLDAQTFGPQAMAMPRWVFYDCSEWPSALFGLAARPADISPALREVFGVAPADRVWVPVTLHVAIPTVHPGEFFEHNVGSLGHEIGIGGLGTFTKALGCRLLRARSLVGAAQWTGKALGMHLRFGPLELITAYTPAHSYPRTLTYRHATDLETLTRVARGLPAPELEPTRKIRIDEKSLRTLQRRIEKGNAEFVLAGRLMETRSGLHAPIREQSPSDKSDR
jgi:hypothetical protein